MELSQNQIKILDVCATQPEIFYFIFAEINYGGQIFDGNEIDFECKVDINALFEDIIFLQDAGLIISMLTIDKKEVRLNKDILSKTYADYACKTVEEHNKKYGYGPHEFKTTHKGIAYIEEN